MLRNDLIPLLQFLSVFIVAWNTLIPSTGIGLSQQTVIWYKAGGQAHYYSRAHWDVKALSTLLRSQKDLRPHFSFSYRFRRPNYNAVSALRTLLYPQCACSNELDACAFRYIAQRNWREIEATSVRHFRYSRWSSLAPGRVYFYDITVFR